MKTDVFKKEVYAPTQLDIDMDALSQSGSMIFKEDI